MMIFKLFKLINMNHLPSGFRSSLYLHRYLDQSLSQSVFLSSRTRRERRKTRSCDDEDICVPALHEIMVPLSVSSLRRTDPEVQGGSNQGREAEIIQSHVQSQYRHVSVSQKRKSDLSYSVGGAQLRKRRRRQHDVKVL